MSSSFQRIVFAVLLTVAIVIAAGCESKPQAGKNPRDVPETQGGHSLIFEIRTNEMERERLEREKKDLDDQLKKADAEKDQDKQTRLRQALKTVEAEIERLKKASPDPSDLSTRMIEILKNRIDPYGVQTEWRPLGGNRFELRIPAGGKPSVDDLKRLIPKTGALEFRVVPHLPGFNSDLVVTEEDYEHYKKLLKDEGPNGVRKRNGKYIWLPLHDEPQEDDHRALPVVKHDDGRHYMLVCNQEGFVMLREPQPGGWKLTRARPTLDEMNRPAVEFDFDESGARTFARLTEVHRPKEGKSGLCLAIVLDDEV